MTTFNDLTIIPLITTVLYIFILVIISTSNETKLSRAFRYYIISMIIWSLGSFLMKTEIAPSHLFWNTYVTQTGFILVPVFLLHFSYVLINKQGRKPILILAYVSSIFLVLYAWSGNVIESADVIDGEFVYVLAGLGYLKGAYIVGAVISAISVLAFVTMVQAVNLKQVELKKVQLVMVGLALVIVGGALNIVPVIGEYAVDIILNAITAVIITYSIYRNKFLEINLIVKRGLYFSIYNIILFSIYASVIILMYNLFQGLFDGNLVPTLLVMSPVFMVLEPIRRFILQFTDNLFYRANKDRQIVLNDFSSLVNSSFSLDKINSSLVDAIQQGVEAKNVSILLRNSNKHNLSETTIEGLSFKDQAILFNSPILSWLSTHERLLRSDIDNNILFKKLWDSEKQVINNYQTEVIVPINYLEQVIGLVIISDREDETPYSEIEMQFLKTLLNNAAAIIENAKTIEILKLQSITDELTKLYNHRYFHDIVGEWMKENKHESFSLAVVDLDQFKIYNDLYGHSAGDKALQRIASLIEEFTPKEALLVRYGGEEFLIYYPNYDEIQTKRAIDKVRKAVEDNFLLSADIREFLTVSIGAACYPSMGNSLEDTITKAFAAVNDCKQSGRNKSIMYTEEENLDEVHVNVQEKIRAAYLSSTYALAATIDAKDHYTYGHSNNVAELSVALAKESGFVGIDLDTIRDAGLLHDIGKVGIPESVLLKKGYLTDDEMNIMRSHVVQSINIIKHVPNLIDTIPIIISHHERYDGGGYPRGIGGESIPALGRVICIADSFDAMTTDRPYRKGLSLDQALYELKKNAGTQFDPKYVEVFIAFVNKGGLSALKLENRTSF